MISSLNKYSFVFLFQIIPFILFSYIISLARTTSILSVSKKHFYLVLNFKGNILNVSSLFFHQSIVGTLY